MTLPNLIIIGPPKCGTTSVFDWLSKHPEACASNVKETNYFLDKVIKSNKKANFIEHGIEKYQDLFSGWDGEKLIFESSPGYLISKTALEEFAKFDPKPYMLFVFRDPAERIYSEFRFSKFKTQTFRGTFREYCGENLSDERVQNGKIVTHINRWIEHYDRDKVLVFHFNDLKNNVITFMQSLSKKLNINPEFYSDFHFDAKNVTVIQRGRRLHKFLNSFHHLVPQRTKNILLPMYRYFSQSPVPPPTKDDLELIDQLKDHYRAETWESIKN